MTTVVNMRDDFYDVDVTRHGQWGNPFIIGPDGTRDEVIEKYREWIMTQPQLLAQLPMLKDKRLGCLCVPLPCHGNVLKELADAEMLPRH